MLYVLTEIYELPTFDSPKMVCESANVDKCSDEIVLFGVLKLNKVILVVVAEVKSSTIFNKFSGERLKVKIVEVRKCGEVRRDECGGGVPGSAAEAQYRVRWSVAGVATFASF